MYDPFIGQWISEDPIGFEGLDENLRRYVKNQVTTHTDPSGLIPPGYYPQDPDDPEYWYPGRTTPSSYSLVKSYSRGGDDEERTYETARITLSLIVKRAEGDPCKFDVSLKYRAHLTGGLFDRNNAVFSLWMGDKSVPLKFTRSGGKPLDFGYLDGEISLGQVESGSTLSGRVRVASGRLVDYEGGDARHAQSIIYSVSIGCGAPTLSLKLVERPSSRLGLRPHFHPTRDLDVEPPYPPYDGRYEK